MGQLKMSDIVALAERADVVAVPMAEPSVAERLAAGLLDKIEVQKLAPRPGELIVLRHPVDLSEADLDLARTACSDLANGLGVTVMLLPHGYEVDVGQEPAASPPTNATPETLAGWRTDSPTPGEILRHIKDATERVRRSADILMPNRDPVEPLSDEAVVRRVRQGIPLPPREALAADEPTIVPATD